MKVLMVTVVLLAITATFAFAKVTPNFAKIAKPVFFLILIFLFLYILHMLFLSDYLKGMRASMKEENQHE